MTAIEVAQIKIALQDMKQQHRDMRVDRHEVEERICKLEVADANVEGTLKSHIAQETLQWRVAFRIWYAVLSLNGFLAVCSLDKAVTWLHGKWF